MSAGWLALESGGSLCAWVLAGGWVDGGAPVLAGVGSLRLGSACCTALRGSCESDGVPVQRRRLARPKVAKLPAPRSVLRAKRTDVPSD